jgi:serine protease Do
MPQLRPNFARQALGGPLLLAGLCGGILVAAAAPSAHGSELRRTAIVKAVEAARPSVVNIHGEKTLRPSEGRVGEEGIRRVNGMGTGVVIDQRGYILTNHHVVEGVQKIQVTLADRTALVARIVAYDSATDLAVIKVDYSKDLPIIAIGTSSDLMTGEPVIAVGNAYGYEHTVTRGIISALHRTVQVTDAQSYEDLIQTDASINPGNSGGPLLNIDGELIGINVAVRAGAQGIGFAIPIDKAMAVAADLLSTRRLNSVWHGIAPRATYASNCMGLVVDGVAKDSPAQKGEMQPGDVITSIGTHTISRALDLERALLDRRPGDKVKVTVDREDGPVDVEIVLAKLPDGQKAATEPTWDMLGLKLESIPANLFQQYHTRYRGGLAVKAVRPGSPAAMQGIRQGDVLVGMHVWETISLENVSYILNRSDFGDLDPIKFYILRGNETLFGHLQVSMRSAK